MNLLERIRASGCRHKRLKMVACYPRTTLFDLRCVKCNMPFSSHYNQPGSPCIKSDEEFQRITYGESKPGILERIRAAIPPKVKCVITGHPLKATGRCGHMLSEWKCTRCDSTYVKNLQYPGVLVPADESSDRIFSRLENSGGAS